MMLASAPSAYQGTNSCKIIHVPGSIVYHLKEISAYNAIKGIELLHQARDFVLL